MSDEEDFTMATTEIMFDDLTEEGKQKVIDHEGVESEEELNPELYRVAILE